MYNSSKHKTAEGGKPVMGRDVVGSFELLQSLPRISSNKIDKSLDFLMMEDVFLLRRNNRGCRVQISDDKRKKGLKEIAIGEVRSHERARRWPTFSRREAFR